MKFITGKTRRELREEFEGEGVEPYRADQVLRWIYKKHVYDFSCMTDLPKALRVKLKNEYRVSSLSLFKRIDGADATKFIFRVHDGELLETVLIKERDHWTLCVSSQIGCAVGCKFCATALNGLRRNLDVHEIVDQFLQVRNITGASIRNVVFMGMGEPLANYINVRKAVEIMISGWGLDLSKRRVTVSTSGFIKLIEKMAKDPVLREVNLAVSVNAGDQRTREKLMPIASTNPLNELICALVRFPVSNYRRITLEYVLIRGVNDSESDARNLAKLIRGFRKRFKVNLIPYNDHHLLAYERPSLESVLRFQRVLWDNGISTFVRFSKGYDVFGACGQLNTFASVV